MGSRNSDAISRTVHTTSATTELMDEAYHGILGPVKGDLVPRGSWSRSMATAVEARQKSSPLSSGSRQARLFISRLLPAGVQIFPRSCPSLPEHYEQSSALGLARPLLNSQLTRSTALTRQLRLPARKLKGPPACNCQDQGCDPLFSVLILESR